MSGLEIPAFAAGLIRQLEGAGFEAFLVGGCVRDLLLGRRPADIDIATSAVPGDVKRVFARTVPTGERFGTVTVLDGPDKAEVTTYRTEAQYDDFRRPSAVAFGGSLRGDLSRRDFTVNAMAYHPQKGLVDPFGGQRDLADRLIRAVGVPDERFREDALRILRAYRFAARLDFTIEEGTRAAARRAMPLCARLSGERVRAELERLLLGNHPALIGELWQAGLFDALGIDCPQPPAAELGQTPGNVAARWAAFLWSAGCDAISLFERLKVDNETKKRVSLLLGELGRVPESGAAAIRRRLRVAEPALFGDYLRIYGALRHQEVTQALATLDTVVKSGDAYRLDMLAVTGRDLLAAGVPGGPECGKTLNAMLDCVIEHPRENEKETLMRRFVPSKH